MIASHWNASGQADQYTQKFWGLSFIPIIAAVLLCVLLIIPEIDPLKKNIQKFRKQFGMFVFLITLFFLYIYLLIIWWGLGNSFNMTQALCPALAILFYCAGELVENSKRNWFIGIRTPWTISSDIVWKKTNKIGGQLMKIAGVIILLATLLPNFAIPIIVGVAIIIAVFSVVYSYLVYNEKKR